jgi:sulfoxide reductase heme-binding subunit YedZ
MSGDIVRVATEIALRFYLLIGFLVLLGLGVLGWTSTDAAIRRMGRGWHRLHRLVYPLALLALWHFALQRKLDVTPAMALAGAFLLLMAARGAERAGLSLRRAEVAAGLAVAAALATAGLEAAWYALGAGLDPLRVLEGNLHFAFRVAPAWQVLAGGLPVALILAVRNRRAAQAA